MPNTSAGTKRCLQFGRDQMASHGMRGHTGEAAGRTIGMNAPLHTLTDVVIDHAVA